MKVVTKQLYNHELHHNIFTPSLYIKSLCLHVHVHVLHCNGFIGFHLDIVHPFLGLDLCHSTWKEPLANLVIASAIYVTFPVSARLREFGFPSTLGFMHEAVLGETIFS
jgi:hypothetical protein